VVFEEESAAHRSVAKRIITMHVSAKINFVSMSSLISCSHVKAAS